jgi:glutamate 5-kinase
VNAIKYVIKIGSNLIVDEKRKVDTDVLGWLASEIVTLKNEGVACVLVTSGAIGVGRIKSGIDSKTLSIREKQALAAVGQPELMGYYRDAFARGGLSVAQILLTNEDFVSRARFMNIRNTIVTLLGYGVTPVINENDTVAVDEIKFGDNDTLSAHVASALGADTLVILTDVEGLYRGKFSAENLVGTVTRITPEIEKLAGAKSGSKYGTGGMASKIKAAKIAVDSGVRTVLAKPSAGLFGKIRAGAAAGTIFMPSRRMDSKKCWLAFGAKIKGSILIDKGAAAAVRSGKSLLASGVRGAEGVFGYGDAVNVCETPSGEAVARGLVNFSSADLAKIKGKHSGEIPAIIPGATAPEVVHRDNLVIIQAR